MFREAPTCASGFKNSTTHGDGGALLYQELGSDLTARDQPKRSQFASFQNLLNLLPTLRGRSAVPGIGAAPRAISPVLCHRASALFDRREIPYDAV